MSRPVQARPLSARNPRVQRLARLARRREDRVAERAFLVEGPVLLGVALDAGADVREVYIAAGALDRPAVAAVWERIPPEVDRWEIPADALARAGDAVTSQGVIGVVARPEQAGGEQAWPTPDTAPFVLLLVDLGDPGNVGTLLRSAAAAGADAVVVVGGVDPTNPKVVRASAGAVFTVPVIEAPDAINAVEQLRDGGYMTCATVVSGAPSLYDQNLTGPIAIVLGNEAHGLDPVVVAACTGSLTVPMAGPTESLNVAMAGTVICFEVLRQGARP